VQEPLHLRLELVLGLDLPCGVQLLVRCQLQGLDVLGVLDDVRLEFDVVDLVLENRDDFVFNPVVVLDDLLSVFFQSFVDRTTKLLPDGGCKGDETGSELNDIGEKEA